MYQMICSSDLLTYLVQHSPASWSLSELLVCADRRGLTASDSGRPASVSISSRSRAHNAMMLNSTSFFPPQST